MITSINEYRKLNESADKIELTYLKTDEDTGNFIYRGTDGFNYVDLDGVMHDMTDEGEPLAPVHNTVIKSGEPVYNPEDRFGRKPGSKVAESVINESKDKVELIYVSTDTHNGNFIYSGNDGNDYVSVKGVIHYMDNDGTPLSLAHDTVIINGEPIYNPDDKMGDDIYSKVSTTPMRYDANTDEEKLELALYLAIGDYKRNVKLDDIIDIMEHITQGLKDENALPDKK